MKNLTAVEFLELEIRLQVSNSDKLIPLFKQANELFQEQIDDAYDRGFKYATKKTYTKEELKNAFRIGFNIGYGSTVHELHLKNEHCESWFKQFKKK